MEPGERRPRRDGWSEEVHGGGCVLCKLIGVEENDWGLRVFVGVYLDAHLPKTGSISGYTVGVWKGWHVSEPTQLSAADASGYWHELLRVGRAIEHSFDPVKMNYETLGNSVPHLHTHVIPRGRLDPAPNRPLPWTYLDDGRRSLCAVTADAARLKTALK